MVIRDHFQAVQGVDPNPELGAANHDAAVHARVAVLVEAQQLLAVVLLQRQVGRVLALHVRLGWVSFLGYTMTSDIELLRSKYWDNQTQKATDFRMISIAKVAHLRQCIIQSY